MEKFEVKSSSLNVSYMYSNDVVIVSGNYSKDAQNDTLNNINGTVYVNNAGEQGNFIGNFNGTMRGDEIRYSLSEMSRADSNKVWDAIDNIEPYVLGENEPAEE